jgi:hypothetical protein
VVVRWSGARAADTRRTRCVAEVVRRTMVRTVPRLRGCTDLAWSLRLRVAGHIAVEPVLEKVMAERQVPEI